MVRTTAGRDASRDGRNARWDEHRATRRDAILTAAIEVISLEGGAVGVVAIADHAGVPRSLVYRHFANRDDLDEQIRTRIIDELMSDLTPALDARGTVIDAIHSAIATYVRWVDEHPHLQQFLGTGSATRRRTGSRVVTGTKTAIALQLTGLVDAELTQHSEEAATGASENLAFGMVGLVDGAVNRWVAQSESRGNADELIDFLTDAVWSVLASSAERLGVPLTPDTPLPLGAVDR